MSPLPLSLEDIFHGKRLCYRITRRYLSGKSKGVVLDVDVPAGCRSGTKQDLMFLVIDAKGASGMAAITTKMKAAEQSRDRDIQVMKVRLP
ncbi:hypothetical protein M378DRAFT_273015 [Amanita muscaria Koide BX008]|uniref:Uncharacterized protein n=1 Tax=Amanita muscaria (strain Koide BX008) TaxID=946122 RepID=A0A0C2XFN6_AMAMK|nr:hypothetical protein M378DRAFT_273015 [Amanita muscaria Koide BX008]